MRVKYNRTSTIQQKGERFGLDNDNYDLTLFDKGVSGKIPFSEREEGKKLTELVKEGKVSELQKYRHKELKDYAETEIYRGD